MSSTNAGTNYWKPTFAALTALVDSNELQTTVIPAHAAVRPVHTGFRLRRPESVSAGNEGGVLGRRVELPSSQVPCVLRRYTLHCAVIENFRHRGLEQFFLKGTKAGIQAKHAARLRLILARLHASIHPRDMNLPGLDLHQLHGERKGTWTVKVSGNWRVTFVFRGEAAESVDYEDYH